MIPPIMNRILILLGAWLALATAVADARHSSHRHRSAVREFQQSDVTSLARLASTITINGDTLSDSSNLHWGMAGPIGTVLDKHYFVIDYNDYWKEPYWVAYHLSATDLSGTAHRQDNFRRDEELPASVRSELADYQRSGFDRGHNAPAADFVRSREPMSETFLLSNMSPQAQYLNRRIWERLESQVREEVSRGRDAWILTGNLFLSSDSQRIEPHLKIGPDSVNSLGEEWLLSQVLKGQLTRISPLSL
jgi:DNA/RNA endonuclease G (NUC1)